MIYPETKIFISDNSGGRLGYCIKVLKGSRRRGAKPGNLVIISLKKAIFHKKLKKGGIYRGILIRGKKNIQRNSGLSIKFFDNALAIVNDKNIPLSNRIFGPVYKELYYNKDFNKILSLARIVI
jgi:large subunit ribosomal protein L14